MEGNKIRIAFVKYGGLSAGGTEKFLQTIAANLDKDRFDVTYYYCDTTRCIGADVVQSQTDQYRQSYLKEHKVKIIKFDNEAKDLTTPTHLWVNTDFWDKFNDDDFDIIQTGRAGHKEYPFTKIKKTPIVDSIHLTAGVDNQYNIARVMHICQWSADRWIHTGGDKNRVVLVSHPIEIHAKEAQDLRAQYQIDRDTVIFGFHQRDADSIFSPLPLEAYKQIESKDTHFILMGGSNLYKEQAVQLGIKNIKFINHTAEQKVIYSFLKTLDVYAHGRKDGEVNSTAIAEAMYFGLPIVSHTSTINNGHVECIADAGLVVDTVDEYANELSKLKSDVVYRDIRSKNARHRFQENYELTGQMKRIEAIYESVVTDPFPKPWRRRFTSFHWTQNIRIWLKWIYLKTKFYINGKV